MSVRVWAVKPGELKPLSRAQRVVWMARAAMRTEPFRPPGSSKVWSEALTLLLQPNAASAKVKQLARQLSDAGAIASTDREGTARALDGECMNYATTAVSEALEATLLPDGPAFTKACIDVAKYAASLFAVLAHGGRVRAKKNEAPIDIAMTATWGALRAELVVCAAVTKPLSVRQVRALVEFWPKAAELPAWLETKR